MKIFHTIKLTTAVALTMLTAANTAFAAQTELMSKNSANTAAANQSVNNIEINENGRYVVYETLATNLTGGTNSYVQIFRYDRSSGQVMMVSVSNTGVAGNGNSAKASISADGGRVVFEGSATNLGSGSALVNVFMRDISSGNTIILNKNASGVTSDGPAANPRISGNGKFVVFNSASTNLVSNDSNNRLDSFLKNIDTGEIERISLNSAGEQLNGNSLFPDVSDDGRFVVFVTVASNVNSSDTNGRYDVYVRDRQEQKTILISKNSNGVVGNNTSTLPRISGDGSYVTFISTATNLAPGGDGNGKTDVFLHEIKTGKTILVSKRANGSQTNQVSLSPRISKYGRYVSFISRDDMIVSGDSNSNNDMYMYDRIVDSVQLVSLDYNDTVGVGSVSSKSGISGDGVTAAFISNTPNMDGANVDTDNLNDAYVRVTDNAPDAPTINAAPLADAGGNKTAECNGVATYVALNAVNSSDPDGDSLTYTWTGPFGTLSGLSVNAPFAYGSGQLANLNVEDGNGASDAIDFLVNIVDTTAPQVNAGADIIREADSANGYAYTPTWTVSDTCNNNPSVTTSNTPNQVVSGYYPVGATTVFRVDAHDGKGNSSFDEAAITVVDTTSPDLTVPGNISVESADPAGTQVIYAVSASDVVDQQLDLVCSPESGSSFLLGNTTVSCIATDDYANQATAAFDVNIADTTPPVFTGLTNIIAEATSAAGALVNYVSPEAMDNGASNPVVQCSPISGSQFALGLNTVACEATDTSGNMASGSFTIEVTDTIAPAIAIPAAITVEASSYNGAVVNYSLPLATDLVDANVAVMCTPASGSTLALGAHTIDCTATDDAGNSAGSSFIATVVDTTAPGLTVADVIAEATSAAGALVNYAYTVSDLADAAPVVSCSQASGSVFPLTDTLVSCTATDASGNSATQTFNVRVQDTIAPVVTAPANIEMFATAPLTAVDLGAASVIDAVSLNLVASPGATGPFAVGIHSITWSATDAAGNTGTTVQTVTVLNVAPAFDAYTSIASINEGDTFTASLSFSDVNDSVFNVTVNYGDGSSQNLLIDGTAKTVDLSHVYADNGSHNIIVTVVDSYGATADASIALTVDNVAPVISSVDVPVAVNALNTAIAATVNFTDVGLLDTHSVSFDWNEAGTTAANAAVAVSENNGAGSASASYVYSTPGVYTLAVTVTDKDGAVVATSYQYIVVYDPSAGFVTGGGWIDSPAGAYVADPTLSGKASFGFVAKYKKGATTPSGNTQFNFKAGDLNFSSDLYDWLVVAGARAQFKGEGSVNGVAGYGFMLTAIDGDVAGGGDADKFRIKIWESATGHIVYDNQVGADDDAQLTTLLSKGSIVIHD